MQIRKGKEFYSDKDKEAVELYNKGISINEIAKSLGVSYSTAYHWIKGIRKPENGNIMEFVKFLQIKGPSAAVHVAPLFRKHNEIFHIASRRGIEIKRIYLGKEYKELSTWYYLPGQEKELENRINEVKKKIEDFRNKIKNAIT